MQSRYLDIELNRLVNYDNLRNTIDYAQLGVSGQKVQTHRYLTRSVEFTSKTRQRGWFQNQKVLQAIKQSRPACYELADSGAAIHQNKLAVQQRKLKSLRESIR